MDQDKTIRVITVHGTFDPGAAWDDPDSVLVHGLREKLGAAGRALDVFNFEWSGENSHEARRDAAERLAHQVDQDVHNRAFAEVFVIGHSHGGTIARLAMNLMRSDRRPAGVFTFGSPFLRFKPRSVSAFTRTLLWLAAALGLSLAFFLGILLLAALGGAAPDNAEAIEAADSSIWSSPFALGAAFAASLLGTLGVVSLIRRWRRYLIAKRDALITRYDPAERLPVGYFCYHAIGDEAGVLLRFWSMVTWLMQSMIFTLLYGALSMITIVLSMLVLQLLVAFGVDLWRYVLDGPVTLGLYALSWLGAIAEAAPYLTDASLDDIRSELPGTLALNVILCLIALLVMAILIAPFALTIPWLLRAQNFAFGGEEFSWTLVADINTDRLPGRRSRLRLCFLLQAYWNRSLQHNYYYLAPKIIDEVAENMLNWTVRDRRYHLNLEQLASTVLRLAGLTAIIALVFLSAVYLAI